MTKKIIDKEDIRELGLKAIQDYFNIPIEKIGKETLTVLHQKAKMGMQFEREMNLNYRAVELNYIRVFKLVAEDKKELKKYIRKSLPRYNV